MFENLFAKSGLSLERLKTFAELVEAQGFTAAARGDPTRQSQFSRQLRELEEYFGAELISRGRGTFMLTSAGKALHHLVRTQFAAMEELHRTCEQQPVEICLGAGESLLQWLVLPRLARIRQRLPKTAWTLQNLQTEEIVTRLAEGRTDLGIITRDSVQKTMRMAPLGVMGFALVFPRGLLKNPSSTNTSVLLQQLPLAVMEGHSRLNEALEDLAGKAQVTLNIQLRCSSLTQIVEAVKGLGFAGLLPLLAKPALASAQLEWRDFPSTKALNRTLALAWNPRQTALRPALEQATSELGELLVIS